ncbi:hypothetical protein SAMN00790413_06536 [Deinococcus hopiensis KR-140]|uniref:Uncharacterized protein n=1 Tax=Deinococcus hopiensis KR-140 TaxID=695939 RepID=A0A1W1UAU0_9DEIO|nr:hypothetical protein SAMN00790413_06536 [Deinococcus hopiensis KR-140]
MRDVKNRRRSQSEQGKTCSRSSGTVNGSSPSLTRCENQRDEVETRGIPPGLHPFVQEMARRGLVAPAFSPSYNGESSGRASRSEAAAAVLLVRGVQLVSHLGGGSGQRGAGYPEPMKAVQEQLLGWAAQGRCLAVRFTGRLAEFARTLGGDAKSDGCLTCARPRWQGTGGERSGRRATGPTPSASCSTARSRTASGRSCASPGDAMGGAERRAPGTGGAPPGQRRARGGAVKFVPMQAWIRAPQGFAAPSGLSWRTGPALRRLHASALAGALTKSTPEADIPSSKKGCWKVSLEVPHSLLF